MKTFDFTGKNTWGFALHTSTFSQVKPNFFTRFNDWRKGQVRASFMVHHPWYPKVGDEVKWSSNRGTTTATIYDAKRAQNVSDMWTLYVVIDQENQ